MSNNMVNTLNTILSSKRRIMSSNDGSNGYTVVFANDEQRMIFMWRGIPLIKHLSPTDGEFWYTLQLKDVGVGSNIGTYPENHPKGLKVLKNNYVFTGTTGLYASADASVFVVKTYKYIGEKFLNKLLNDPTYKPIYSVGEYKIYEKKVTENSVKAKKILADNASVGINAESLIKIDSMPYNRQAYRQDLQEMQDSLRNIVGAEQPENAAPVKEKYPRADKRWQAGLSFDDIIFEVVMQTGNGGIYETNAGEVLYIFKSEGVNVKKVLREMMVNWPEYKEGIEEGEIDKDNFEKILRSSDTEAQAECIAEIINVDRRKR